MVQKTVLLSSFTTWKAHQFSNSSDDLLREVIQAPPAIAPRLHMIRHLPVNVPVALELLLNKIQQLRPDIILCCGMAESRTQLSLESRAIVADQMLYTPVPIRSLLSDLNATEISEDAGRFVCNGLYYAILNHLQGSALATQCLFVHVPPLTSQNRKNVVVDFCRILEKLAA
ncbi:MAG TPA: peptidase C15 [Allocoleopsis sp.]